MSYSSITFSFFRNRVKCYNVTLFFKELGGRGKSLIANILKNSDPALIFSNKNHMMYSFGSTRRFFKTLTMIYAFKKMKFWKNRRVDSQEYIVLLFYYYIHVPDVWKTPCTQIQGQRANFKFSQKSRYRSSSVHPSNLQSRFVFSRPQNLWELILGHFHNIGFLSNISLQP